MQSIFALVFGLRQNALRCAGLPRNQEFPLRAV
jgi:hypothetical protein